MKHSRSSHRISRHEQKASLSNNKVQEYIFIRFPFINVVFEQGMNVNQGSLKENRNKRCGIAANFPAKNDTVVKHLNQSFYVDLKISEFYPEGEAIIFFNNKLIIVLNPYFGQII